MIHDIPIRSKRQEDRGASSRLQAQTQSQVDLAVRFGAFAALCDDRQLLLDETCRVAAEGLEAGFAKLLVYRADERCFVLQAGVGWREGLVGEERLDSDTGTAAGFAWHSGESVVSNDMVAEGRFRMPGLLGEHGIGSSINVVVAGEAGAAAFGVLEVEGRGRGEFRVEDVGFLQLLAHSLAAAVGRVAGQALREAEGARDALDHRASLMEMHHRVRNDLQGVCDSVGVEARRVADTAQRRGFGRISGRVLALAGLYDHLLGVGAGREVEFGGYLRTLCRRIVEAGGLEGRSIDLHVETEAVTMSRRRALSLAVAVNELVSNAAEHAFVGRHFGRITVTLRATGGGGAVLGVADTGCGFAGPRPGGAGLGFVEGLVQQAGGVLEREDGQGTLWRIVVGAEGQEGQGSALDPQRVRGPFDPLT